MGRIDPLDGDSGMHLALPSSLVVAATAATIAIITSICAFWRTDPQVLEDSPETAENLSGDDDDDVPPATQQETDTTPLAEDGEEAKELPQPPCMRALTMANTSAMNDRCSSLLKKSTSSARVSSALSVKKHFRSISVREIMEKNRLQKPEDSLCKKPILLGGKCRIGGQLDDGDDDNDGKVNTAPNNRSSSENPYAIAGKDEEEM